MVVVTGASGLIGSFVLKEILKKEEKVRVIINKTPLPIALLNPEELDKIEIVKQDLCDIALYDASFKHATKIIHCAGKVSFNPRDKEKLLRINFELTKDLINYCLKLDTPPIFIFISSVATLSNTQLKMRDELTKVDNNITWNSMYSQSKYLAEKEVIRGQIEGLKTIIVNPSVVLGPTLNSHTSVIFLITSREKENIIHLGLLIMLM